MTHRRVVRALLACGVAAALALAVLLVDHSQPGGAVGNDVGEPPAGPLAQLLAQVRTTPTRLAMLGYDRSCQRGHACSFGSRWTDNHTGRGGHNSCDTRDDVLRAQLVDVVLKPGTHGCVVLSGTLNDPYTGRQLTWSRRDPSRVQIDHIYPLALAWDMGAASWPAQRRIDFANDQTHELVAVDGHANQAKGDAGPGSWLPLNRGYRCTYLRQFLVVAITYDLPITTADAAAIKHTAGGCQ
ncbi:MAG TPA: HNH endonuclease family protein [Nocardioides sp.]